MLRALSGLVVAALLTAAVAVLVKRRRAARWVRVGAASRDAEAALRRHPAGRGRWPEPLELVTLGMENLLAPPPRVTGPDDDEDFLRALHRQIHGGEQGAGAA